MSDDENYGYDSEREMDYGYGDDEDNEYGAGDDDYIGHGYGFEEEEENEEDYQGFPGDFMQEPELKAEATAYERAGMSGDITGMTTIAGDTKLGKTQGNVHRQASTPEDRFRLNLGIIIAKLDKEDDIKISTEEKNTMSEAVDKVNNIQYKNVYAYILGFIATKGGRIMDEKQVKKVIYTILPTLQDVGVEPPDVIRYARMWKNL